MPCLTNGGNIMVNNINSEPEERLNYHGLSKFLDNLKTLFAFKTDMPAKLSQLENDVGYKTSDTVYTHPSYTAKSSGLYKVSVDSTGHINSTTEVTKADITQLGILSETPSFNDTTSTYSTLSAANTAAETSSNAIKSGVNILTTLSNIKKTFAAIIQGLKILGTNVGMIQGITSDLNAESDYVAASAKALSTINSNLGSLSGFRIAYFGKTFTFDGSGESVVEEAGHVTEAYVTVSQIMNFDVCTFFGYVSKDGKLVLHGYKGIQAFTGEIWLTVFGLVR